ncbi:ankyrin repeat domain-containing protein|uniref:ankyrin repeat domain-containing protein n=1 Tax=Noviherbaspirillum sp. L7-7A TaxID=2850560 RepID=UPI001C2C9E6C|nr:ankyrin repeat domain-containing protein [Noviherbaspirillum sp. L7-7A]MBV0879678.1 ankyrin repeat domain-containing protein [Noviherbaspirillum sp. L7-7A]
MEAAIRDDIALIDRLLTHDTVDDALPDADLNETDEDGWTALHHAASKGSDRAVMALLERGARTDPLTRKGATALMLAARNARGVAVEILLALDDVSSASESQPDNATSLEKSNLYRYQLAAQCYDSMSEHERQEALSNAVVAGKPDMAARMLATGGLDFENPDRHDITLLGYAVRNGDETMVRLLLCAGAKANGISLTDTSPLMHAVLSLQLAIIPVLLHADASPIQERADRESALTMAVRLDSLPVMRALIADKPSLLANGKRGKTLLTLAVAFKSASIATELLNRGVDLPDKAGSCALAVRAKKGDQAGVAFLLAAGADPDHQADDGHSAFTLAAANGHLDVVQTLLNHRKQSGGRGARQAMAQLLNQVDKAGRTALMLAALNGHQKMLEFLLNQGADLHRRDIDGMNALLWAVARADAGTVNLLFNHHATHLLLDRAGNSGIVIAAANGNLDTLKVLLTPVRANKLYDVNTPNKRKDTALTLAAANGHEAVVRELLQAKAHVLHVNAAGRSAKLEAIAHGHEAITNLLEKAEQAFLKSAESTTGILAALARIPVFGPLLPSIAVIKVPEVDREGNSALALAACYGHVGMVSRLIGKADAALSISMGSEMQSAENDDDNPPVGKSLIHAWQKLPTASSIDIEQQNVNGMTPLCLAAANGRDDVASLLLERGALVNHASNNHCTPLWLAASAPTYQSSAASGGNQMTTHLNSEALINLLLDKGANVNQPSARGETPLHAAAAFGRLATVKTLLQHKASLDAPDRFGLSALGHAALNGHADLVEYLLEQGAKPDAAPGTHAPLTLAAANGHDAVVILLRQRGATVQHVDAYGRTALIFAARHGKISTVELLLKFGANLHHKCRQGYTAQQHASRAGHSGVVALLQEGHPRPRDN